MWHRNSHWLALLALVLSTLTAAVTLSREPAPAPTVAASSPAPDEVSIVAAANCPNSTAFTAHTYRAQRLVTLKDCVTVTGTVEVIRREADGDEHVLLKLDPSFAGMTNSVNDAKQQGDLVIEPECVTTVTQSDAIAPCQGAPPVPALGLLGVGAHATATGPYVTDQAHLWNEIHPVESVTR